MFCTPGNADSIVARVSCGLDYYFGGPEEGGLDDDGDDVPERRAVSWLVAKAPKAMQRPIVFNQNGYESFRTMRTRSSDILIASYPRCGLSWIQAIAWFILRSDDQGRLPNGWQRWDGSRGPTFCEARTSTRMASKRVANQVDPRILTTHARAEHWPEVLANGGKIIVISRDPRDTMVSTFFRLRELGSELRAFGGLDDRVSKCAHSCATQSLDTVFDDFNDDGDKMSCLSLLIQEIPEEENLQTKDDKVETFEETGDQAKANGKDGEEEPQERRHKSRNRRFYADYYTWHAEVAGLIDTYGSERIHIISYEDLHEDPVKVTRELDQFLRSGTTNLPCEDPRLAKTNNIITSEPATPTVISEAKINTALDFASFENVQARGNPALRKGVVGDHKVYLTPEHWEAMVRKTLITLVQYPQFRSICQRLVQDTPNALRILSENDRLLLVPSPDEKESINSSELTSATTAPPNLERNENNIITIPLETADGDGVDLIASTPKKKKSNDSQPTHKRSALPNSHSFRPNFLSRSRPQSIRRSSVASPKTSRKKSADNAPKSP